MAKALLVILLLWVTGVQLVLYYCDSGLANRLTSQRLSRLCRDPDNIGAQSLSQMPDWQLAQALSVPLGAWASCSHLPAQSSTPVCARRAKHRVATHSPGSVLRVDPRTNQRSLITQFSVWSWWQTVTVLDRCCIHLCEYVSLFFWIWQFSFKGFYDSISQLLKKKKKSSCKI